jgi:protein-S-isoprenylcysteine O-methyltransferase Ste14
MQTVVYLLLFVFFIVGAYWVFRVVVKRDYERLNRLSAPTSLLELLIWCFFMVYPSLYSPEDWALVWLYTETPTQIIGLVLVVIGALAAFGTMAWFGIRRAMGLLVDRLVTNGVYRFSRNPQIVGGALMALGAALQSGTWYAAGWLVVYAVMGHLMVMSEEEHLLAVYGEEYRQYYQKTPRYLGVRG